MGAKRVRPRAGRQARGRHSVSPRLAAELVRSFRLSPGETVVEIGAGSGRLTRELTRVASVVLAIELDAGEAQGLLRTEPPPANLFVHRGDALDAELPPTPFRLVGNIPFGISTGLLRRFLDDDRTTGAELIVQLDFARRVTSARGHVLPLLWATAWELELRRRIPARCFHPAPSVDAAWLSATRREPPLIRPKDRAAFERFVRRGFRRADVPVNRSLDLPRNALRRGAATQRPLDLDVVAWLELFEASRGARHGGSRDKP